MMYKNRVVLNIHAPIHKVEAELFTFYHENGGDIVSPFMEKISNEDNFVKYAIYEIENEEHPDSTIVIASDVDVKKSNLTIYLWDSENWGLQIDNPHKGVIGSQFLIAKEKSRICIQFCERFLEYISDLDFSQKSKKSRFKENDWAIEQLLKADDFNTAKKSIFEEWMDRRKQAKRGECSTTLSELFDRNVTRVARKSLQKRNCKDNPTIT